MPDFNIKFKSTKLQFKTIISVIALAMALLSFSAALAIIYSNTTNFLNNKITGVHYSNMNQISQKIEISFSEIENLTKRISNSYVLRDYLDQFKSKKSVTYDKIYISQEIRRLMDNAKKYTDGVDSILLITPDENFFVGEKEPLSINYSSMIKTSFYDILPQNQAKPVLLHLNNNNNQGLDKFAKDGFLVDGSTLFASRIYFDDQEYGIIIIKISDDWVKNILNENYRTVIMDKHNILWKGVKVPEESADSLSADFLSKIENEEGILYAYEKSKPRVFYKKLSWGEWYLIYFEDMESSKGILGDIGKLIIVSFLISVAISLALSKLILNKLIEPFNNLIDHVRKYKTENETSKFIHQKKDKFSMKDRIFWYFALVIIVPLSIFILSYYVISWNTINDELVQTQKTTFNQTAENISLYIERKIKAISSMSYDRTIQEALVKEPEGVKTELLYQVVNGYMLLASGYDDISFYNMENRKILSSYNKDTVYNNELDASFRSVTGKISWLGTKKDELNRYILRMVIKVNGSDLSPAYSKYILKHIGNIVISLNEAEIEQIYRDIYVKSNAKINIIDNNGYVISSIDKSQIGTQYLKPNADELAQKNNSKLSFNMPIEGTPWVLVGEYGYNSILEDFKPILYYSIYLLIIICLILVIISYLVSFKVAGSISRMSKLLTGLQFDDIPPEFPQDSHITEVDELAGTFNDMITRIDTLIDDLIISKNKQNRLEMQKRDAEILALQSQIKPHFLCNTLESIRCLVKEKKEAQAVEMIKNVSDLFRYGISKVENLIGIGQELAHALAYTRIMGMRFESIAFTWNIEEGINEYMTPKMILQPIIENAIYHGIVPKKSSGLISIECKSIQNSIIFIVSDDGVGIDEQKLEELKNSLKNDVNNRIGVQNVQKRLRLYFGEEYNLSISSVRGEGTSVIITIPKIKSEKNIR